MRLPRSLLTALLLLACGGQAAQTGTGGAGGLGSGGSAGSTIGCCNIYPECPAGERYAQDGECPELATCDEVSACCSSAWCVPDPRVCPAGTAGSEDSGPTHDCNGITCTASQACVAYRDGSVQGFAYQCTELCGACQNQAVTCACAQPPANGPGVCAVGYEICSEPGPGADSSAQLLCQPPVK